jgi:DNA/RNA endonuclease YhcR with UshA esterase domain
LIALLLTASAWAQAVSISAAQAAQHVGEEVVVVDRIAQVFTSNKGNTFLNFGGSFPNHTFCAVVFVARAGAFSHLESLSGKRVRVSGTISSYRGKPQIILESASQIEVL